MGGNAFIGRVVSNRMQKSVVVAVSYVVWVPKYKVYEKRVARHMAHDEKQECVVGDLVKINASRKYSKHKSYRVTDVLKRMPVYTPQAAQQAVAVQDAKHKLGPVEVAQQRYDAAQARLAALKKMFRKELGDSSPAAVMASLPQATPVPVAASIEERHPSETATLSSSNSHVAAQQGELPTETAQEHANGSTSSADAPVEHSDQGTQSNQEGPTSSLDGPSTQQGDGRNTVQGSVPSTQTRQYHTHHSFQGFRHMSHAVQRPQLQLEDESTPNGIAACCVMEKEVQCAQTNDRRLFTHWLHSYV